MVLVHPAVEKVESIKTFPCVGTLPTKILGEAGFADEPCRDAHVVALKILLELLGDTLEVGQALAQILSNLFGRLALHITQITVDLDGNPLDGISVAAGINLDDLRVEPPQDIEPVAN